MLRYTHAQTQQDAIHTQPFTVSSLHPTTWTTLSYYKHLLCRCFFTSSHIIIHSSHFHTHTSTHTHTPLFTHLSYAHMCPVYTPEKVTQIIDDNPVHVQMFIAHTHTYFDRYKTRLRPWTLMYANRQTQSLTHTQTPTHKHIQVNTRRKLWL